MTKAGIGTAIYSTYYILLHKVIGIMYAPILFGMLYGANTFANMAAADLPFGGATAVQASIGLHVLSWIFQIGSTL